ncbi:hypothetical protein [Mannheimia indoligenes]|uniref:hypothetical protein n=1 Tax=Mannheimia indoligenes TaxID=3103145 RepID=UPI002FE61FC3
MTEKFNNIEVTEHKDKRKWYQTEFFQNILACLGIASCIGITSACYEIYWIPKLESRIEEEEKKVRNLDQQLSNLRSSSELVKLQKENRNLEAILDSKNEQIEALKSHIQEVNRARTELNQKLFDYEKNNKELIILNNKKSDGLESLKTNLASCKNNLNLKNEIDKLRTKIEDNNRATNRNDMYRPSDIQIQTYREDNKNLNRMIEIYQQKLHCQN